jgi:hypothetical protein
MKKMSLPGFTAEASLSKIGERYRMVSALAHLDRGVIPQQFTDEGPKTKTICRAVCELVCVWFGGSPENCHYACEDLCRQQ